jgi:hypothetical protein
MNDSIAPHVERGELTHQLTAGQFQSLPEVVLNEAGRLIQKITRNPKSISHWYSEVMIGLVTLFLSLGVSLILGEASPPSYELISTEILMVAIGTGGIVLLKAYMSNARTTLRDSILNTIQSDTDVIDLRHWLKLTYNPKNHLIFSLALGVLVVTYRWIALYFTKGSFVGVGPTIATLLAGIVTGMFIYSIFVFLALPVRLGQYEFSLYAADPGSSTVVQHWSSMVMSGVYMVALFMVGVTVLIAVTGILAVTGIVTVLAGWVLITLWFALNQYALARIIRKAKWRTLAEIQAKIEQLRTREDIPNEQTLKYLNQLMDYHDRIRLTRNSVLDLRAGLNLLNSLLLPLFAFILANLDKVLALFR